MNEEVRHFSLRKLSVGLASVLIGVSIFGTSQTVKADTVANNQTSSVTSNAQSSDTQKNENAVKSTFSSITPYNNVKSNLIQTQDKAKNDQTDSLNQNSANSQEANNSNDLQEKSAEKNIVRTSSLQESNNQSNKTPETALQTTQNVQSFNLKQNSLKLVKKVLATNLIETNSLATTNGGFDEATWGKLDVNNWQGSVQDGVYQLINYNGDSSHIIVPNEADFEKAGKSTNGLQVGITKATVRSLLSDQIQTIAFSKTNNQKVKAIGTDWTGAFASTLSRFDGSSLDVSNVTSMHGMFAGNKISDLTSLASWDVSNVTDMSNMFAGNKISDLNLTPLAHWDTSKVTDMTMMFEVAKISNLTPLANWDVSNVTGMNWMFAGNSISNLTPLAHWNTSKVYTMMDMFAGDPIIDLRPIANWNISDLGVLGLFRSGHKLDLTNINNTPLMQGFLKRPDALIGAIFITNNADLVKATIRKNSPNLPTLTNTAKRTITFNLPHAEPKTITQTIYYKAIAPVQVDFYKQEITQTYPVKESDWPLDTSKQNDDVIIDGAICFKPVKIPHVNGYKAHLVRNPLNSAMLMVSFVAVPSETKPSLPAEVAPSKPSANADNTNKPADDLQQRVITELNSNDSGWTMPNTQPATYTIGVPTDATIDLSDLVIAEPVHAQTRTQIHVTKRFKLSKKYLIKHLKHRKKAVRQFKKYRL